MRKRDKVVGFYKDKRGGTRPITKSEADLKQKRIIQHPRSFKSITPKHMTNYIRALRLLSSPQVALVEARREDRVVVSMPATLLVRNKVQGLLMEGRVDRLKLKDVKGNTLFDSEVVNPKARTHWFIAVHGNVAGDFHSKAPITELEAIIIARTLWSQHNGVDVKDIAVSPG